MENLVSCLSQISAELDRRGVRPGELTHAMAQLELAFRNGGSVIEQNIKSFVSSEIGNKGIDVNRFVDVVYQRIIDGVKTTIHNEVKTGGGSAASVLDLQQLKNDAAIAIKHAVDTQGTEGLANIWRMMSDKIRVTESGTQDVIKGFLMQVKQDLRSEGFTTEQIKTAIGSFNFVDATGKAIHAILSQNGRIIFEPAMDELFSPDGKVAQAATKAASNSPNFSPAMDVLFGPSGKVADAATDAAAGANLKPAADALEKKVEDGVTTALNQAGDKSKAAAAAALAGKVGAGATALGNIMTSVPQFYDSITALGEAWNKPLNSTKDYMTLFSATGNAINQGVQMFQALAGVTQIASAAQAVFNAVMAMNPVVLIVMAVIALIAAIALLIIYWDEVKAALRDNPWLAVAAVMFGLIGIIIVIIAYWDEIKLAALKAANFVSIQIQRIGQFFVGLGNLVGQVWDFIVASAANVGIGVMNMFITLGTEVQNFFIGLVNAVLSIYNEIADSVVGDVLGLDKAELIPEVDVETRLIPPKEVPEVSLDAAFKFDDVQGGLEGQIAAQEQVVQQAQAEDEARRAQAAQPPPAPAAPPVLPTGTAPPAAGPRPDIPAGLGVPAAGGGGGPVDASVTLNGGITVNINAERLEADAAQLLSDEIINAIQARLGSLRSEQDFRTGNRAAAA